MSNYITPDRRLDINEMMEIATAYFDNPENKPFSIAKVCLLTGTDKETLVNWTASGTPDEKSFVWFVRYSALASWEQGDKYGAPNASLIPHLLNRYFADEEEVVADDDRNIFITVQK